MLLLFGGAAFLFLNALLINQFIKQQRALSTEIATVKEQIKLADFQIAERPQWEAKGAWLAEHQRELKNEGRANEALLNRIESVGRAQQVIPQKPKLQPKRTFDRHQAVSVGVDISSEWPDLVKFMYYLQEPEDAVVFERMILSTDPQDSDKVKGSFTISQYYAPQ